MSSMSCRDHSRNSEMFWLAAPVFVAGRMLLALALTALATGCSTKAPTLNSNNSSAATPAAASNANTDSRARSSRSATIDIKEPDRYSAAMTISSQEASDATSAMPTLQFTFTRIDSDRRWDFALSAPSGHVVYLEKSGLKYLILLDRKQYVEVSPSEFGVDPGRALAANSIAATVKDRAQFETLGVEPVNARTARKYRFEEAGARADGAIYIDLETGLAVRSELNTKTSDGGGIRVMVEASDLQLNPDRSLFDVPAGMKKVSVQEAKSQIQSVTTALRHFADMTTGNPVSLQNKIPAASTGNANRTGPARR